MIHTMFHVAPLVIVPALLERGPGWVLVVADPRNTKRALTEWVVGHATVEERDAYRVAYGGQESPAPCPDWWLTDERICSFVPEHLRLDCYDLPERRVSSAFDREAWALLNVARTG